MKKTVKNLFLLGAMGLFGVTALTSCSNATQKYADKITNEASDDDGKYITYSQAVKALGKECIDITINDTVLGTGHTGVLIAVKGCKSTDEIKAKLEAEETVKGIVITVTKDDCIAAVYKTITADDLK